jgi:hypothetical protein
LLAGAGVAVGLALRGGGHRAARPTVTTRTARAPTSSSATQPPPQAHGALQASRVTPYSATVTWRTAKPTTDEVAVGPPGAPPTLWASDGRRSSAHAVTLSGLAFSTPYAVRVTSTAADGRSATAALTVTTPGPTGSPRSYVSRGVMWVDGNPFFPLMVFDQCADTYDTSLRAGINLFAGDRCGHFAEARSASAGKALAAATADNHETSARGAVAWFLPDEADGHGLTGDTLPAPPPDAPDVRFLTLTSHFYSGAAPLAQGRGMYPGLVSHANVVGFDLYPLQNWCQPGRLADVYWAQRELARLVPGKPTYQWIEAAGMGCPTTGQTAITPATVRAESLLALAGGAHGLGFFPAAAWTGAVGSAIAEIARTVHYLGPALLGPGHPVDVAPASGPVEAGAWADAGALYVIAVNSGFEPTQATIHVPGLGGRPLLVFDEGRQVRAQGDSFGDGFAPLAAHVYIAAP